MRMPKTLVTVVATWQDGARHEAATYPYLMEGLLAAGEAEEKLREAIGQFFVRAGEGDIREAWEESSGDFNFGDCLGLGYGTDYFEANGIVGVVPGKEFSYDGEVTVTLNHDEHLFPQEWEDRMLALDGKPVYGKAAD